MKQQPFIVKYNPLMRCCYNCTKLRKTSKRDLINDMYKREVIIKGGKLASIYVYCCDNYWWKTEPRGEMPCKGEEWKRR